MLHRSRGSHNLKGYNSQFIVEAEGDWTGRQLNWGESELAGEER